MSDPRANTGNMKSVHSVMMTALFEPKGVEVVWTVEDLGSLEACAKEARGFHQNFASLRARSRRLEMARLGQTTARDTDAQGAFDALACSVIPLPADAGWKAWLGPWKTHLSGLKVYSVATGKLITPMGAESVPQNESEQLVDDAINYLSGRLARFSKKRYARGERLGLWTNEDGTRWFLKDTPSEERLREIEEAAEDEWIEWES